MVLGLAVNLEDAVVLTSLTGSLDSEFEIFDFGSGAGLSVSQDWVKGYHLAMRTLVEKLDINCFSSGGAWPPITSPEEG